ncbi:MAG TPA: transglutaminase family protein [Burkholderiales bacterium]|nr:transglutaminase family protein [Burkholderiales bacterium]
MKRRTFLHASAAASLLGTLPRFARAAGFDPRPGPWRYFDVTTRVDVLKPSGVTRVWVPLPSLNNDFERVIGNSWAGNAPGVKAASDPKYGAQMVYAEWPAGAGQPQLAVTSRVALRDRAVDFGKPDPALRLRPADARFNTEPTALIPTDGIVRKTALEIVRGEKTELGKARAIYQWIVDNTFRDPKVRGCGIGDVKSMLETGNLGGKCADLNSLYVGLARAAGLAARDVYGVRVAKSAFGYKSLGAGSPDVTKAQHCRADVFVDGYGWVPVDPADVRKVVLEEPPGKLPLDAPKVVAARKTLFGHWEMNWMAYNTAHDIRLPGSSGPAIPFLMYPQAETAQGRLDPLDPADFRYTITAGELAA